MIEATIMIVEGTPCHQWGYLFLSVPIGPVCFSAEKVTMYKSIKEIIFIKFNYFNHYIVILTIFTKLTVNSTNNGKMVIWNLLALDGLNSGCGISS